MNNTQIELDKTYLYWAYKQALKSYDTSTQNGAILLNADNVIGTGNNIFPFAVEVTDVRLERPLKYTFTEHAERNAIFHAARQGHSTQGSVMYALWAACDDCARAIIQAGVKRVVTHDFYRTHKKDEEDVNRKDWGTSISTAFQMLEEAQVDVEFVNYDLKMPQPILFNGDLVKF